MKIEFIQFTIATAKNTSGPKAKINKQKGIVAFKETIELRTRMIDTDSMVNSQSWSYMKNWQDLIQLVASFFSNTLFT